MDRPKLLVVIDTEEEFDWSKPFDRHSTGTTSIPSQDAAQAIFADFGVVPTYVIDYPVAADPVASGYLRGLKEAGRAVIGAHLHPWVTPPHEEEVNLFNSYHGNLPRDLERAKLMALTDKIAETTGERPTIFKAGRYGLGPNTLDLLVEAGYRVDCSVVPHTDFSAGHGPNFLGYPDQPYMIRPEIFEVPLTTGFIGWGRGAGATLSGLFDRSWAQRMKLIGVMAKTGFLERSRLSPEGIPAAEQCALLKALVADGRKVFSLTYHSPSLTPGHTPYVRTREDLKSFLASIQQVLAYFRDELGGEFTGMEPLAHNLTRGAGRSEIDNKGRILSS